MALVGEPASARPAFSARGATGARRPAPVVLLHEATAGAMRDLDRLCSAALRETCRKKRKLVERDVVRLVRPHVDDGHRLRGRRSHHQARSVTDGNQELARQLWVYSIPCLLYPKMASRCIARRLRVRAACRADGRLFADVSAIDLVFLQQQLSRSLCPDRCK